MARWSLAPGAGCAAPVSSLAPLWLLHCTPGHGCTAVHSHCTAVHSGHLAPAPTLTWTRWLPPVCRQQPPLPRTPGLTSQWRPQHLSPASVRQRLGWFSGEKKPSPLFIWHIYIWVLRQQYQSLKPPPYYPQLPQLADSRNLLSKNILFRQYSSFAIFKDGFCAPGFADWRLVSATDIPVCGHYKPISHPGTQGHQCPPPCPQLASS